MVDTVKLIKLLNLTSSNFDGEALNAMRMANKLMKDAKIEWKDVITSNGNSGSNGWTIFDDIMREARAEEERTRREKQAERERKRQEKERQRMEREERKRAENSVPFKKKIFKIKL